jgi:predicted ABC-class ATPase
VAKKSTNVEIDERVNTVYDLLLRAYSRTQIVRYCSEHWNVGERQAENYMARARQLLALDAELERPQWFTAALARLLEYERRASGKDQINTAIKALEDQAKLLRFEIS